ncbi:TPA: pilus assembly protein PilS [Neisseria gonorrhoeae]|nr:pilus assembly protein PilS [Neisseria gonorrhoeae]ROV19347.1 pilus assembly protein PilS [Neisseria gonorrhoeae]ROV50552.1 pilus assembly protein PilS [Neisseria gonorrhoeae]RPF84206.1 pilus assembly protein PilS [Neisseria gonorrhoeae]
MNTETYAPSFPRRRESGPWNNSNIQRLSEALGIPDSRFRGNDEF